ncbi:MAG: hypothetical protein IH597_12810 [Bacteroidales bacterium]|nr:hypothetical protein [Bacteroidales bacterium]
MKPGHLIFIPVILVAILIVQCRHEPENVPIVGDPCHPDTVYFERDILPLLLSSCAFAGCHDAATASDGVILDSYSNVKNTGDVKPGNPNGSDLYEVLVEDDEEKRMPKPPYPRLGNDQIAMVRKWILQGAKDLTCDEE